MRALVLIALLGAACGTGTTDGVSPSPAPEAAATPDETPSPPSTLGPNRWCNEAGECASLRRYQGPGRPFERPGPEHCNWDSATFIAFRKGQYVRDEDGSVVSLAGVTYDPSASLPEDAEFTGWSRREQQLWVSPSEFGQKPRVYRNIYIVRPDGVERLPVFLLGCV